MDYGSWSGVLKIAFDQQVFLLQEYGGISRYICSLAKELAQLPDVSAKIFAPLHFNGNLNQLADRNLMFGLRAPKIPKTFRPISMLSAHIAHAAIKRFKPDIVHESYYSNEDFRPCGALRVVTVYDMIHEKFALTLPQSQLTTSAKRAATERSDHVICISHNTKQDLIDLFGVPKEKISVAHLACDLLAPTASAMHAVSALGARPFLLYVGSRGGYKNFTGLLTAYASSTTLKRDFSIISFGGGSFNSDERTFMAKLGIETDRVIQIGGGDELLAALYSKAAAFVYPSMYEGFGIPPLEAMSLGCPVVSSDTSSLPEVVGNAGEYFNPNETETMRVAIEAVVQSPSRQTELIELGYRRNSLFSWKRCAEQTESIYRGML